MKRLIAIALLLAMMLTLFAGCNSSAPQETEAPTEAAAVDTAALEAAAEYLKTIYKEVEESTPIDFQRVAAVRIGLDSFDITWSANVAEDLVKIVESNGMVTIDVNEENPEDVPYVLTATISDAAGNTKELSWNHFLPAAIIGDFSEILDMAYALEDGESLPNACTLTGIISTINTAWSDDYQNITVTIVMEGCEDKPVMCYRLKGEGAKDLAPGDQITVTGTIKNYKGTIEFDAGCTLDEVAKGVGETAQAPEDPAQIIDEAYALADGQALPYTATLTGKIIGVDTAWSEQYKNITVTIVVEGSEDQRIMCYRLKGDGAKDLFKDDVITVTGTLKNYHGTIEFDAGCQLIDVVPGPRIPITFPDQPEDPNQVVDEAFELVPGANLPYNVRISGYVTAIISPWNDQYHNITVNMVVPGREDKVIQCYRMHGSENGADTIEVGDYITVFGSIKNYNGTIEFHPGAYCEKVVKGDGTLPWVPTDPFEIIDEAYALEKGQSLPYTSTLTGTVTAINTAYSEQYKNVTVTIAVPGRESKPIMCYRMKGADAANVEVGDTITVTGTIKNYNGTVEFDAGCTLDELVKAPKAPSLEEALEEAKGLANGKYLDYVTTVEGVVTVINTAYSSQYKNITFTIDVNGTSVYCYRIKGDGMDTLAVGDTVKVSGNLTAYNGKPQFDSKATVTVIAKAGTGEGEQTGLAKDLEDAAKLSNGQYLDRTTTVTGQVSVINTAYSEQYKNITFTVNVDGTEVYCYRVKGEGMDTLKVGDTVTVSGNLTAYNGKPQFDSKATVTVHAGSGLAKDLEDAAKLSNGQYLDRTTTITGKVSAINTAYSSQYKNITFTVDVDGTSVYCYRIKGNGMDILAVGDTVSLTGKLTAYNGKPQFDSTATVTVIAKAEGGEVPEVPEVDASSSLEEILAACSQLNAGEYLTFQTTITEEITWAGTYSSQYGNITVNMDVGAYNVQAYRLKGTGVEQIAVGDTITVTGYLGKNTKGNIAFKEACTLVSWTDNTP